MLLTIGAMAGTAMGLVISAFANTRDQATTIVPLALVPQLILAGVLVPKLPDLATAVAKIAVSGYWLTEAMKSVFIAAEGPIRVMIAHTGTSDGHDRGAGRPRSRDRRRARTGILADRLPGDAAASWPSQAQGLRTYHPAQPAWKSLCSSSYRAPGSRKAVPHRQRRAGFYSRITELPLFGRSAIRAPCLKIE